MSKTTKLNLRNPVTGLSGDVEVTQDQLIQFAIMGANRKRANHHNTIGYMEDGSTKAIDKMEEGDEYLPVGRAKEWELAYETALQADQEWLDSVANQTIRFGGGGGGSASPLDKAIHQVLGNQIDAHNQAYANDPSVAQIKKPTRIGDSVQQVNALGEEHPIYQEIMAKAHEVVAHSAGNKALDMSALTAVAPSEDEGEE